MIKRAFRRASAVVTTLAVCAGINAISAAPAGAATSTSIIVGFEKFHFPFLSDSGFGYPAEMGGTAQTYGSFSIKVNGVTQVERWIGWGDCGSIRENFSACGKNFSSDQMSWSGSAPTFDKTAPLSPNKVDGWYSLKDIPLWSPGMNDFKTANNYASISLNPGDVVTINADLFDYDWTSASDRICDNNWGARNFSFTYDQLINLHETHELKGGNNSDGNCVVDVSLNRFVPIFA